MSIDKRKHPRFAFPNGSDINAKLNLITGEGAFSAKLLNISLGGIGLAAEKEVIKGIESLKENIQVQIMSIGGSDKLNTLIGQTMSVRWILNYDPLKNVGIGCEFLELNTDCRKTITELLEGE